MIKWQGSYGQTLDAMFQPDTTRRQAVNPPQMGAQLKC